MNGESYEKIWNEAFKQIRADYKSKDLEEEFDIWFRMEYSGNDLNSIKVSVPSEFMLTAIIKKGYLGEIESKITELCGRKIKIFCFVKKEKNSSSNGYFLKETNETETKENEKRIGTAKLNEKKRANAFSEIENHDHKIKKHPQLKEDFTFDNFVCGENNEYAYSASLATAKQPGKKYNPLFIYGGVGLGKTHLMQAIGNYIFKNSTKRNKICYITAENFLNEMTFALRDNSSEKFKQKYRTLDVLLLDDIHFLQNKTATQEEIFFTFEALSKIDSQIVFTCDRPPSELNGINDRLKSRFISNLTIDLQPPSYEVRKAILLKKLELKQKYVSEEVVDFIAKNIQSNVRELEACLENTIAYSELLQKKTTVEIAKKYLNLRVKTSEEMISISTIQQVVADYYNVSVNDIQGAKRNKKIAFSRHIAIYISRILTDAPFNEIAFKFGKRDHSTVIYSFNKIDSLLKVDESLNFLIDELIKRIKKKI